jgi:O-antigen ligase
LVAAALFSTLSVFSLLALLVGVCANLFSRIRHGSGIFLAALMLGPYLLVLLPSSVIAEISAVPFFEDIRLSEVLTRWRESLSLIGESFFTGQGIGEWGRAGASNLLLEMLAETGIFTLFVFLFLTALRCVHSSKYQRYVRRSQVREVSYMCTTVIAALFALGVFTDIFSDVATYYLFWCIFGIGSATMRIAKRERDDRVGYFTDGSDVDSSSIDITIRQ